MVDMSHESLLNRIHDSNGANPNDLQCCICNDLLWKPVECINCHSLYCVDCIENRSRISQQICRRCQRYEEGVCHPFITRQLNRLQMECTHHRNGCQEIISYEFLQRHEAECGYRYQQCSGCQRMILERELQDHTDSCGSIQLTCSDCQLKYTREEASSHTEIKCLREQILKRDLIISNHRIDFENFRTEQMEIVKIVMDQLDQAMIQLQQQSTTNQCVDRRLVELSFRIPNSLPPYPARWQMNGITVAGGQGRGSGMNQLNDPGCLFVDEDQTIYVTEFLNERVVAYKVDETTRQIVAGGNGKGRRLDQLDRPTGVIVDRETDSLVICDSENRRVTRWPRRPLLPHPEIVTDNIDCFGLSLDDRGSLYISDWKKNEVRRYDKDGHFQGTLVAGGHGKGDNLNQLNFPTYLFVDAQSTLYISDADNHRVMKWTRGAQEGIIVAGGNGRGDGLRQLFEPQGIWVDGYGHVYVVDSGNHRVMRWEKGANAGTVIAGGNGQGAAENQLSCPEGLFFDRQGRLYVTDCWNGRVQRFTRIVD